MRRVARLYHNPDNSTTAVYRDSIRHVFDALGIRRSKRMSDVSPVRVNGREMFQATLRTTDVNGTHVPVAPGAGTSLEPTASRAECVAKEQEHIENVVLPALSTSFFEEAK